jgi:hypothetical protein
VASWFETRGVTALLTMRVVDLILRSAHLCASRRMKPPYLKMPLGREDRASDQLAFLQVDQRIIGFRERHGRHRNWLDLLGAHESE